MYTGNSGQSGHAFIVDGNAFYTPIKVVARHISYERVLTACGWETLALSFAPTKIAVKGGKNLEWQGKKDMALLELKGAKGADQLVFDEPSALNSGTPYLFTLGEKALLPTTLVFAADDVTLDTGKELAVRSSAYEFVGTLRTLDVEDVYTLDGAGKQFQLTTKGTPSRILPFRAYLKSLQLISPNQLRVDRNEQVSTGIDGVNAAHSRTIVAYNMQGQAFHVEMLANGKPNLTHLPKGVYIIGVKKLVR